ncbi:MAG: kinase [Kiritimatiellae bacterium]|nr:kinase [Kiritimatiellia bacterium]
MIISRTPFRISFFGGGSDFPEFYKNRRGCTLSTTIDKYCYISLHYLSPFFKFKFRASYAMTETVQEPAEFQHPLIRECLRHLPTVHGLEIAHVSDLPGRTGLGTSSSFTVGLLNALHAIRGEKAAAGQLAREAVLIERGRVGDPGGHQDQYAAAYGGLLRIDYNGKDVRPRRIRLNPRRLAAFKKYLQLFFMGMERTSGEILRDQKKRAELNVPALERLAAMAERGQTILERGKDMLEFGKMLNEAWALKKGLANGISNSVVDQAYEAAQSAGALGGKLLGAGGGGFILLFVPPEKQPAVRAQLANLMEVPFEFSREGSRIIFKNS